MNLKQTILETLNRDDLKTILDDFGIDGVDRRSVDEMRKKLSRARRVSPAGLLEYLRKDEIKEVCEAAGLSGTGKKQDLIDRLLSNGAAATKSTKQGTPKAMSDTAEEKATDKPKANVSNGTTLDLPCTMLANELTKSNDVNCLFRELLVQ